MPKTYHGDIKIDYLIFGKIAFLELDIANKCHCNGRKSYGKVGWLKKGQKSDILYG